MSRGFSRPSAWLRQLLVPSSAGPKDPDRVSTEVSLVQPFDGSGWAISAPASTTRRHLSDVGALTSTLLFTMSATEVMRLLAVSFGLIAGGDPTQVYLLTNNAGVTADILITENVANLTSAAARKPLNHSPILLPGTRVFMLVAGGDASTQVSANILFVEAPVGTVFYV